jgi:adenylate cyclase
MAERGTATLTQLKIEQDYADSKVLAESSIIGERMVSVVRLAVMLLIGFSTTIVPRLIGEPLPKSPVRMAIIFAYLTIALVSLVMSRRVTQPTPRRAFVIPFFLIAADFSFGIAMGLIDASLGVPPRPETIAVMLALYLCFSIVRISLAHVIVSTALAIGSLGLVAAAQGWFDIRWICFLSGCYLGLGMLVGWSNRRIRQMFMDIRRRENLSRFLPRQVVDRVLRTNGLSLNPVQREVTILFSDIRDFTAFSEGLPPKEVLAFLGDYFAHMTQIVKGHEGLLNKFLGDGLLAVWGVPDLQDNHAERALRAALDMRRSWSS